MNRYVLTISLKFIYYNLQYFQFFQMAMFYVCHSSDQPIDLKHKETGQINSLLCASRLVSKAALRLSDISLKLQMSKVARYLEKKHSEWQSISKHLQLMNQSNSESKYISGCSLMPPSPSILKIKTSNSLLDDGTISCQSNNKDAIFKKINFNTSRQSQNESLIGSDQKQNIDKSLVGQFKWRQVETKNNLEDHFQNKTVKFRESLNCNCGQKQNEIIIKKQHSFMKLYIQNILKQFQNQGLVKLPKTNIGLEIQYYQQLSQQLFQNYHNKCSQQENNINNLLQVRNFYLQSLNRLTIKLGIDQIPSSLKEYNLSNPIQYSTQKLYFEQIESKLQQLEQEINSIEELQRQKDQEKKQLQNYQEKIKKYEMLLFIKEEQIGSLKIINQNLQNRLSALAKLQERPRARSYKKYFQNLDENLRATIA